jgi:hypothetical protein
VTESLVSASDAFAGILAARADVDREVRRKTVTRTGAVIAVALLHVLLLYLLVLAERMAPLQRARTPHEVLLLLMPAQKPVSLPRIINANPEKLRERIEEFENRPINLPPVVAPPRPAATDVLRALGVELACGASHYEYLSPVERKLCKHPPWKMPAQRNLAVAPPPPPQTLQLSGAEAAARVRAQAAPCPLVQITPCVDEVIYGKGGQDFKDVQH